MGELDSNVVCSIYGPMYHNLDMSESILARLSTYSKQSKQASTQNVNKTVLDHYFTTRNDFRYGLFYSDLIYMSFQANNFSGRTKEVE